MRISHVVDVMILQWFWGSVSSMSDMARKSGISSGPCTFPMPSTPDFDIFCQTSYHKTRFICDPGGVLSRTEAELLSQTAAKLNFSSCFCNSHEDCKPGIKVGVLFVPNLNILSLRNCDPTLPTTASVTTAAMLFSQLLASRWQDSCEADVLFVYIASWHMERARAPLMIPMFSERWQQLRRFSVPVAPSTREPAIATLKDAFEHAARMIAVDSSPAHAAIPRWALFLTAGMFSIVAGAIYIANLITKKMGGTRDKQKSSLLAMKKTNDKFRAGFGGGMMMASSNSSVQKKKSVMMFRTFSKHSQNRNNNNNRL